MREHLRGIRTMVGIAFRADPRRAALLFACRPAVGLVGASIPLWLKLLTDGAVARDAKRVLVSTALLAAVGLIIDAFIQWNVVLERRLREAVDMETDRRLIDVCARIPTIEHHERPEYLDRIELLRSSRGQLSQVVTMLAAMCLLVTQVGLTLWLLVTVHPAVLALPLLGIPTVWMAKATQRWIDDVDEATAEDNRRALHLFDLATMAPPGKELRVFGLGPEIRARHHELWTSVQRRRTRIRVRAAAARLLGWSLFSAGLVGSTGIVALQVSHGRATAGDMMLVLGVAWQVNSQLSNVAGTVSWLLGSLRVVDRLQWLLDYAGRTERELAVTDPAPAPDRLVSGITLAGVSFRYPGATADVLGDVSVHLPAGATVALVGHNGAGKSTLVKLLCRFYEPTAGAVFVDGVDLRRIGVEEWRGRLAGAFQDFVRFELPLREAVGLGHLPTADGDANVVRALERASATDVVDAVGGDLGTVVGPAAGGVDLSGGQWQKLAVARAMMRPSPLLLLLDEPTAALDADTEHRLFSEYASAARAASAANGAVTLIVSHRFSTVRMADLIVVVDDHGIAESGTHAELVARGGLYATLYELQARSYR